MAKVLVFSGSNSSSSINQQFAIYAASFLVDHAIQIIHLKDYPAPIYSMDQELRGEFPDSVRAVNARIKDVDGLLISLPEYNSGITPVFKNMMDWISRLEKPTLKNKALCLLSTSPGSRGAKTNLAHVSEVLIDRWGGILTSTFSLPYFDRHLVNGELELLGQEKDGLLHALTKFDAYIRGIDKS